jgi:FKBP-type peptidyl-prolyl cis-trans isomerase FkpA
MRTAQLATIAFAVVAALGASLACKKSRRAGGLEVEDLKAGDGAVATAGKAVTVHYTGWLLNGKKFDSSYDHDPPAPINFVLGTGRVIKGWDMGLEGMRVGGKRKLTIPPPLAYGERGTPGGPIPPSSTLVFDVDLVGVQ